jgi:hypothetical protein
LSNRIRDIDERVSVLSERWMELEEKRVV